MLCQDLASVKLLAAVLSIFVGGCLGEPFWIIGSPGKEHHARLVQGLWNWQV